MTHLRSSRPATSLSFLLVLALASGCMGGQAQGLGLDAEWQGRDHARMTMHNRGGTDLPMAELMAGLAMHGPNGTIPLMWGAANGTRMGGMGMMAMMHDATLGPGESWTFTMHAGRWNGTWGMMMTPESGLGMMGMMHDANHTAMMPGDYTWSMGEHRAKARLS